MIVTLLTIGLLLIPSSHAFWRLPCAKPVLNARADPIVSFGKPSSHGHTIMGSSGISFTTTFEDLVDSNCTTCMVNDDRSIYWAPELFYEFANGSFKAVDHGGMLVYYLQRGGSNETIEAFPDGLRMVTGNPNVRNYTGTPEAQAISWLCIDFNGPAQQQTPGFTNTTCPDGLRAQIFFPSCWDGMNLDSPDHKSHMAYPSGIDNGYCPHTHPVHLVSIFYELWFSVAPFNALNDGGRFLLSTGDPTGCSLHGDFYDGWNKSVLQRAVDTCTDNSGVIQNCGVFANENRFVPDAIMNSCQAVNPLPNEDVIGPIPYLPGCVAITEGPAPATGALDPNCVAASGNVTLLQNTSSNSMPASSSLASPSPSTMPDSGGDNVMSSSPASPSPSTMPASGDDSSGDNSVPSSSPASPSPSTMPASGDDPSGDDSVPSSSPASPSPTVMPASGDVSDPSSSPASPMPSSTHCHESHPQSSLSALLPAQSSPPDADPSPSSTIPAPPSSTPPNPMMSNTPAPANLLSGNNNTNGGNGNSSSSPSPSPSPMSGDLSSLDPGAVTPSTSLTNPSSTPPMDPAKTSTPKPQSSGYGNDGNNTQPHGNNTLLHGNNTQLHGNNTQLHGNNTQQQDPQDDDSNDGEYCTGQQSTKRRALRARRSTHRHRHLARRAGHGSYMRL